MNAGAELRVGDVGVLQNLVRSQLNGLLAEVTGPLQQRMLYNIHNPADSEICQAYRVRIPGYPLTNRRMDWCVKAHQLRRLEDPDSQTAETSSRKVLLIV